MLLLEAVLCVDAMPDALVTGRGGCGGGRRNDTFAHGCGCRNLRKVCGCMFTGGVQSVRARVSVNVSPQVQLHVAPNSFSGADECTNRTRKPISAV